MEEIHWGWREWEVERLITRASKELEEATLERYEILDLRKEQ